MVSKCIDWHFRYHNSKRLLPDYTQGMNTTVETKMNDPIQVNSKPANDESIVVDMDDKKSKKKNSKIIEQKKKVSIEKESVFYEASLILKDVKPNQSGNYTCGPSNSLSASVRLHITQGKI